MKIKIFLFIFLLIFPLFSMDLKKFVEDVKNIPDNVLYYKALDGKKLAYRFVSPENPKGVLIFVHGIVVYGKYYLPFAQELAKYGIKVYLPDLRGHGNSEGKRGDSPDTLTIVQDLGIFYQMVLKENPLLPIYLGGHSMGAGLTLKYVKELNLYPSGVILIGGGLPVENISPKNRDLLRQKTISRFLQFLSPIFPHFRVISFDLPQEIKDPLLVTNYSLAFFRAVFPSNMKVIWEGINLPILAIVGDKDEFLEKKDVERVFSVYKRENRSFIILENTDHIDVLEKSIKYIIEWITGGEDGRF
ncbi:MAG: lysophospholipase [Dictyoglomus sp.]|nr:lysophospholipase [Dictyoglomus sp.]MCX7845628.1 lysophospholipase [Dictyoglomaceae bacterium]MDW8189123.1 alpha/beta fold hydrolase [Dictyoglomus sp.]